MRTEIQNYLEDVSKQYLSNHAREHSYRPALENLLKMLLPKEYMIINEPAHIECGAPDFVISKHGVPISFIECKDIANNDLDGKKQNKEQFSRYKSSLNSILFTDYLDFHLYEHGKFVNSTKIAELKGNKIVPLEENELLFLQLIERLSHAQPQSITSPEKLAIIMANKTRLLKKIIETSLEKDITQSSKLWGQLKAFRDVLIHDLNEKTFADIYAQTICYGLFAARFYDREPEDFSRMKSPNLLPQTNPFLREFFNTIATFDINESITWIVDDLAEAFRVTDMSMVMSNFSKGSEFLDPIFHFYEGFLKHYDPELKKQCGVYYTPQPVVNFMVHSVDSILKKDFNLPWGLADFTKTKISRCSNEKPTKKRKEDVPPQAEEYHRVQILDPATGTGTFIAQIIRQIHENLCKEGMQGMWAKYAVEHLVPRLHGFELMMAPYAMAHLQLGILLNTIGGENNNNQINQRLHIYLTNSLEQCNKNVGNLFAQALATEVKDADSIKENVPVMVMIGNPPYSKKSSNKGEWIQTLLSDYKKNLKEKNISPLTDDYLMFIRLGEYYIHKNGSGIMAYISNNSFIDGLIHREMRKCLMKTFDKIYILNLHGSNRKEEVCPDGGKDENVFGIVQGVSINIFVKRQSNHNEEHHCQVFYSELLGEREKKYDFLQENSVDSMDWQELNPHEPFNFFVPKDFSKKEEYEEGFKLTDLMEKYKSGIKTHRDAVAVHFTKEEAEKTLKDFQTLPCEELCRMYECKDVDDWKVSWAQEDVKNNNPRIVPMSYRPFDFRCAIYTGENRGIMGRPIYEIMKNMLKPNLALSVCRQQSSSSFQHILISNKMIDMCLISSKGHESDYLFPLYIYSNDSKNDEKKPNLNRAIWDRINNTIGEEVSPEQILDYIYAVLHTPAYRNKYRELLKIDFPCIPYPKNREEFVRFCTLGTDLRKLHLMEKIPSLPEYAQYSGEGDDVVKKVEYREGNVYINSHQCFCNVPEVAWNFSIGGHQPSMDWLKVRKGRTLTFDDIIHYHNIVVVLIETDRLMKSLTLED